MAYDDLRRYTFSVTCETDDPQGLRELLAMCAERFSRCFGSIVVHSREAAGGGEQESFFSDSGKE